MDKIQGATATRDRKFTKGITTTGSDGTIVSAEWLNNVQEEICNVIAAEKIQLDEGNVHQLNTAINKKIETLKSNTQVQLSGLSTELEKWKIQINNTILTLAKEQELKNLKVSTDIDKTNLLSLFEILNKFNNEFVTKISEIIENLQRDYNLQDNRFTEIFNAYAAYIIKNMSGKLNESTFHNFVEKNFNSFVENVFKPHKHPEYEVKKGYFFDQKPLHLKNADLSSKKIEFSDINCKNFQIIKTCHAHNLLRAKESGFYNITIRISEVNYEKLENLKLAFATISNGLLVILNNYEFIKDNKNSYINYSFVNLIQEKQEIFFNIFSTQNLYVKYYAVKIADI
ncbi:hypothetical protein [Silvanigrella aquatica]|uniref:Uncharacterized protein n=1 Tax=Silvanigrella aquatica TaxID=1915309 RepID=A0A1L4D172_9BACT|nr:hypothetical protein [Silvanigrella aquatica]APJ03937.1 hypothetical protein AXG55_08475 [Silvanigrella aquatica]